MVEKRGQRLALTVSRERIEFLITKKTAGNVPLREELRARVAILCPYKRTSDRLGLNTNELENVRSYARKAGMYARKEAEEKLKQSPLHQVDKILESLEGRATDISVNPFSEDRQLLRENETETRLLIKEETERIFKGTSVVADPREVYVWAATNLSLCVGEGFTAEQAEEIVGEFGVKTSCKLEDIARAKGFRDESIVVGKEKWPGVGGGEQTIIEGVSMVVMYSSEIGAHNNPERCTKIPKGMSIWIAFSPEAALAMDDSPILPPL